MEILKKIMFTTSIAIASWNNINAQEAALQEAFNTSYAFEYKGEYASLYGGYSVNNIYKFGLLDKSRNLNGIGYKVIAAKLGRSGRGFCDLFSRFLGQSFWSFGKLLFGLVKFIA